MTSLDRFVEEIQSVWTGLDSQTIHDTHRLLRHLINAATLDEPWLAQLHDERPATVELYRDPLHDFILLGHTEPPGHRWPPHDHGAGWVFYAVQHGESRMETYKSVTSSKGETRLVSRGSFTLGSGQSQVFLPGDVHSTECLSDYLVQLRLTGSDFKAERDQGRMIQYADPQALNP